MRDHSRPGHQPRLRSTLPRDVVLNKTAYPVHKGDAAKQAFETVRNQDFITDNGDRGIKLDNAKFGSLVQFLYDDCNWERFELELRIKHFEGTDTIDWHE